MNLKLRVLLLALALFIWFLNGIYAVYVNTLRMEQFKLVLQLRNLRKENDRIYWEISRTLNYDKALRFARAIGMVEVKPYRVLNFYPYLKDKTLLDFYMVWVGDRPSKIAKKLGVPLKELVKFNPSLRWGYVVPGQLLKYPVSFPFAQREDNSTAEEPKKENSDTDKNGTRGNNLVPGKTEGGNGRGGSPNKLQ